VNLARALAPAIENILIASVEIPTTLIDVGGTTLDVWQGNCTFGDGAAALWIGTEPREGGLAIEDIRYRQRVDTGLDLIRSRPAPQERSHLAVCPLLESWKHRRFGRPMVAHEIEAPHFAGGPASAKRARRHRPHNNLGAECSTFNTLRVAG